MKAMISRRAAGGDPEQTVEQVEHWGLYRNVKPAAITDDELTRVLAPLLQ